MKQKSKIVRVGINVSGKDISMDLNEAKDLFDTLKQLFPECSQPVKFVPVKEREPLHVWPKVPFPRKPVPYWLEPTWVGDPPPGTEIVKFVCKTGKFV